MPIITDPSLLEYKQAERLMGNTFEITVVASDQEWAYEKIGMAIAEIQRICLLYTSPSPRD